jgi:hypothetical protein
LNWIEFNKKVLFYEKYDKQTYQLYLFLFFFRGLLKIPSHISILHVEQEVIGDETIALDSVLECDEERNRLLKEEKQINAQLSSR